MLTAGNEQGQCDPFTTKLREVKASREHVSLPGESMLVDTGCHVTVPRDPCTVLANFPPTGAGTITGRLKAIDVGGHMLLLWLGLEVGIKVSVVRILVSIARVAQL